MRQEVEVTVTLTYDADAELSTKLLKEAIQTDICRLLDADYGAPVELHSFDITSLKEEAEIYNVNG